MEQTSLVAYEVFKDNFNKQEKVILELLLTFINGLTINELTKYTTIQKTSICGRLGDLRKKNIIYSDSIKKDPVTQVQNKIWKIK